MKTIGELAPFLKEYNVLSITIRICLAMISGGLIGYFRDKLNKQAGFRTHILVCIACASTILAGEHMFATYGGNVDPSRIGAQAIAALGFLGAGTIITSKSNHVIGLTTAAGLWSTAAIGLAFGAGAYELGIIATILILISQNLLKNKLFKEDTETTEAE